MARDLGILTEQKRYKVKRIQPVDMFPFTEHVETVVCLSNKNARSKDYVEIGVDAEDYYRIKDSAGTDKCGLVLLKKDLLMLMM
jgi:23S rRNA (uracil1939-C5)-methyltransferase